MASFTPDVLVSTTAALRRAREAAPARGRVDLPVLPRPGGSEFGIKGRGRY